MAPGRICWRAVRIFLVFLVLCELGVASGTSVRRERHVSGDDDSTEKQRWDNSFDRSSPNSLSYKNNGFTASTGKKRVSQRLVGGHKRLETTTESPLGRNERDDSDEANWDDGLIISSAGNGKEKSRRNEDDDEKKTLSQQVKEGKYGLIQNEIYPSRPKRPGIISYLSNPEVPKDNAKNLGGLDEEEIWLAENHVLVLRGGNFPEHGKDHKSSSSSSDRDDWLPIDDYKAPKRQVKIPPTPKVPPPFPVQLTDNGPIQIIGANGTSSDGKSSDDYENDSAKYRGFLPGEGPFFAISPNGSIVTNDLISAGNTTRGFSDTDGKTKSGHVPPRPGGVIGPFYPSLPPEAVFVVPPGNLSDYDEDDQSIYYPPPYSFFYKQDNSTPVPPGPLVPGIILPPPPDFFAGVEEKKQTTKSQTKYSKTQNTTPVPRVSPTYYPPRKSSVKPYKGTTYSSVGTHSTAKHAAYGTSLTMKPVSAIKYKTTTGKTVDKTIRVAEKNTLAFVETTPSTTKKASSLEITEFFTTRPNTFADSSSEKSLPNLKSRWISDISSKSVPLLTYYSSSTPASVRQSIEVTPASINNIISTGKQGGTTNQASYYFYEESNDDVTTGTTPNPTVYYRATTEAPYYRPQDNIQEKQQEKEKKSYFAAPTTTHRTPKEFRVELLEPVSKTSSRYQYTNPEVTTKPLTSSRIKGQRMLTDPSPLYKDVTERPRGKLPSYYTTTRPRSFSREPQDENNYDYDESTKPKPIYQYTYESADYLKRGRQQESYKPETQQQSYYKQETPSQVAQTPEPFDEWQDIRDDNQQYDYEPGEELPAQQIQPEREIQPYRNRLPISYPTSTPSPIIDTTPNPQHAYYTKQDEQLLDDVTKEYFTNFGKKLTGGRFPSTTPLYGKSRVVTVRPKLSEVEPYQSNDYENERQTISYKPPPPPPPPRVKVHYGDQVHRPYSLEDDTLVNYQDPLPTVEPESEWIPGYEPKQRIKLPVNKFRQHHTQVDNREFGRPSSSVQRLPPQSPPIGGYAAQRILGQTNNSPPTNFVPLGDPEEDARRTYSTRPLSLEDDIAVNYGNPRPPINPDAEYIDPAMLRDNRRNGPDKAAYFAYRLPGDSGHFYFLTPQAINQRQDEAGGGYLYTRPRGTRFSRQRRRGDNLNP